MDPTLAAPHDEAPQVRGSRPLRVLVVEDNSINRVVAREMLEHGGHTVEEAHDGQEGVAMAARRKYDLVLMDISMPVLDGVEATRMIRAAEEPGRHVPIVALTAHALPGEIARFRDAGLDDVLIKPISRTSLGAVLDRVSGSAAGVARTDDAPAAHDASLVDEAHVAEMRALLGDERTARQIALFLSEIDALLREVTEAPASGTAAPDLRASVHRAAGSAAILGATALREHLGGLETRLAADAAPGAGDARALEAVALDTRHALERLRAGLVAAGRG
jgi:CheY-like chemotaxis protein